MTVTRRITGHWLRGCHCRAVNQRSNNECCRILHSSLLVSLSRCDVESKRRRLSRMNTTTLPPKHSMSRTPYQLGLLLIPLVLACFALSPQARAVDPPPDGGYPGFNTAEGQNALLGPGIRSGATPTAASTRVSARERSFSTSETKVRSTESVIRQLARRRFIKYHRLRKHGGWNGSSGKQRRQH
jgi:hypothetical protein